MQGRDLKSSLKSLRSRKTWIDAAYDPNVRGTVFQALLAIALLVLAFEIVVNTAANLKKQNIASGFEFLTRTAGFDVSQSLIPFSSKSTYFAAFLVGLTNTLLVASLGVVLATIIGFALGIARGSPNWLASRLALGYVELVRNVPLLLQLLVWYVAVLRTLPTPQDALALPGGAFADKRGLHLPAISVEHGGWLLALVLLAGVALAAWGWMRSGREGQLALSRGQLAVMAAGGFAILLALALVVEVQVTRPALGTFNFEGGVSIEPEFLALLIGLSTYTAAFIAEIVRAGLDGVPKGQREAAAALGLSRGQALRLVVLPQALRIIIPPLTNQYLNLTKNSSLAVAIGYPDLVSVFSGTVLNQTGQAVEVILITMAVYLTISLATAVGMNWFNTRTAWAER